MRLASLLLLGLCVSACHGGIDGSADAGGPPPDQCNSREEALSLPECELTLGEEVQRFLSFAGDQDWYRFRTPATASARTLIHVTAVYPVPSTAVNLAVNLLRGDGQESLARLVDDHGQAAPSVVSIVRPFATASTDLVLLLEDAPTVASRPNFDLRSPYILKVSVADDPDVNEPNDQTPTPLTLVPVNGIPTATSVGYLSTEGDVDRFSFDVPAGGKVAYVRLTAARKSPPPPFRFSYTLLDPTGTRVAEGRATSEVVAVNLATARLARAGIYTLEVQGYRSANASEPVPGDPSQPYNLEVRVLDQVDPNEPNDTLATARAQSMGSPNGGTVSFTGRLGHVPDPDWFAVDLPAQGEPTRLHYKLVPTDQGGRFEPLPGLVDRQLRVLTEVSTGATPVERQVQCVAAEAVCPKGYAENAGMEGLVEELCQGSDPSGKSLCLRALRSEATSFVGLSNFEGVLQVPPSGSSTRYAFLVQDEGNSWADDRDYRLEITWSAEDGDEQGAVNGSGVEADRPKTLANDSAAASYPNPPTGSAFEVTGQLSHGFGRLREGDRATGRGVRGPNDYDSVPSDRDVFMYALPAAGSPADLTWELQWEVGHAAGAASAPHQLLLDLTFCDGDKTPGSCTQVSTGSSGVPLTLSYQPGPLRVWHLPSSSTELQPAYSQVVSAGKTTVTLLPFGCGCLEPRFVRGGTMFVTVSAAERMSYAPVPYTLRMAYSAYPKSYLGPGDVSRSCPAPMGTEPGCRFSIQR